MVVGAVAAVFSAVTGFIGKQKQTREIRRAASDAQREERKQRALANRQQALERQRSIRQSIAQSRVVQAQLANQGFGTGAGSGVAGSGSAMIADTGTALGASQTQFAAQSAIAASQDRRSTALQDMENARMGNGWTTAAEVGQVVGSIAKVWGGGMPGGK